MVISAGTNSTPDMGSERKVRTRMEWTPAGTVKASTEAW